MCIKGARPFQLCMLTLGIAGLAVGYVKLRNVNVTVTLNVFVTTTEYSGICKPHPK